MLSVFPQVAATLAHVVKTQIKGEISVSVGLPAMIEIIEPQPLKMNELAIIEQGERLHNWRKTWTTSSVAPEDVITYGAKSYKVHQVDDRNIDGSFYRVLMRELTSYKA